MSIALDRKGIVDDIIRVAFPGENGKRVSASVASSVRFSNTQWDEGNRTSYVLVSLETLQTVPIPEQPYIGHSPMHEKNVELPVGVVCVAHNQYGTRDSFTIYTRPENVFPALEAPVELSRDEMIVLVATRSRKSSYGGVSNYRFHEAHDSTGITLVRWDAAKAKLIAEGYLNKAGAITTKGRNAAGTKDLYALREQTAIA